MLLVETKVFLHVVFLLPHSHHVLHKWYDKEVIMAKV